MKKTKALQWSGAAASHSRNGKPAFIEAGIIIDKQTNA